MLTAYFTVREDDPERDLWRAVFGRYHQGFAQSYGKGSGIGLVPIQASGRWIVRVGMPDFGGGCFSSPGNDYPGDG